MTGFNTALPIAQCWLPGQVQEDFEWALATLVDYLQTHNIPIPVIFVSDREQACLNALATVFPTVPALICRWHMNRNVLSKAREILGQVELDQVAPGQDRFENTWETDSFMASYFDAVNSKTEQEFEEHRVTLAAKSSIVASYLDRHWWKYKTQIVRCWTKQYSHFGYQVTSAVEGTHAKCKRWLQTSRGDLYTVFHKLLPWWISAARALSLLTERNATITPYRLQVNRYSSVVRIVTIWALNATDLMWKEAESVIFQRRERTQCTGSFRRTHGRPCVHELIGIIESNGVLKLKPSHFHPHWWVRREITSRMQPRIEEPAVIRTQRKKRANRNHQANQALNGTARDPIFSERVDRNHPASPPQNWHSPQATLYFEGAPPPVPSMPAGFGQIDDAQEGFNEDELRDIMRFSESFTPSRSWGYAGLRPYQ